MLEVGQFYWHDPSDAQVRGKCRRERTISGDSSRKNSCFYVLKQRKIILFSFTSMGLIQQLNTASPTRPIRSTCHIPWRVIRGSSLYGISIYSDMLLLCYTLRIPKYFRQIVMYATCVKYSGRLERSPRWIISQGARTIIDGMGA